MPVLFIEISPSITFAWARWMSDTELVPETAQRSACLLIRADESPHVGYSARSSEMRDRTWIGSKDAGTQAPRSSGIWEPSSPRGLGTGREEGRQANLGEVEYGRPTSGGADILGGFIRLVMGTFA